MSRLRWPEVWGKAEKKFSGQFFLSKPSEIACLRSLAGAHHESGSDASAAQMTMVAVISVSCTEARLLFLEQVIDVLHPGRANVSKVSFPDGPHWHI